MEKTLRLHRTLTRYDPCLNEWAGSLASLAIRCFVGWQFFKSGLLKIEDWSTTLELFRYEYHVPLLSPGVAAAMGATGELLFPVLLFAGILTRPASLGLLAVNLMAVISYPQLFQLECPAAINDHFYWGVLLLVVFAFGAGRFSIDAWLSSQTKQQAQSL